MSNRDFKIPPRYKTLLMLALVFGPFFWLAFTEDGQWRTDLALMFVLGKEDFNPALDGFHSGLSEARLRETFPDLDWRCADGANPFGDRLCGAEIGAFNGLPSSSVTLFLDEGRLHAVKVVYRRAYHERMHLWVESRLKGLTAGAPAAARDGAGAPVPVQADGVSERPAAARDLPDPPAAPETSGPPEAMAGVRDGVRLWPVAHGALLLRDGPLGADEEPALLWLAREELAPRG